MDTLLADIRYALRLLRKAPVFTLVAVGTLALGIGANVALFSIVDAVLVRPLPYADPDRLVMVWEDVSIAGFPKNTPAPGNYFDWRRLNHSFVDMAATRGMGASLTGDATPEQVVGRGVTPNFFAVLGVTPLLGRTMTEQEDRTGAQVVLISHGLWQRRFAGDPAIVGRTMLMNDSRFEIIAVLPSSFVFRNRDMDYWVPINLSPEAAANRNSHYLNVVGRLKPGVALAAADADLQAVAQTLKQQFPLSNRNVGVVVSPIKEDLLGNTDMELRVLMAAAVAILLIACANLGSLILTRASERRAEFAVRSALGASRTRLVRQMVVEGVALSLTGGLIGLAIPPLAWGLLANLVPQGLLPTTVALDWRIVGFAFALSVATGLLFSLAPAMHAVGTSVRGALQQNSRGAIGAANRATRDALVVLQVSAALVLLVAAGLMLRTLGNLRAVDVGFRADHLLTLRTSLPRPRYADPVKRFNFYDRVMAGVRALPGVEDVAFASTLPFQASGNTQGFRIDGRERPADAAWDALNRIGTARYLLTLRVQLVEGRLYDDRDGANAPLVVVINETFAQQFWPNSSAIGQRLAMGPPDAPWRTIVGVVKDVHERGFELAMKPGFYLPAAQASLNQQPDFLVVRVAGNPMALSRSVQQVIADVDPEQPVSTIRTMDDIIDLTVADRQQQMVLLVAFATLALLLASLGLYGMLAYAVAGRSREIGLRMALGATPQAVMTSVIGRGLGLTAIGTVIGAGAAWGVTRLMNSLLFGVGSADPVTFGSVIALLGVVAACACAVPAMRAARVDPMVVLREP